MRKNIMPLVFLAGILLMGAFAVLPVIVGATLSDGTGTDVKVNATPPWVDDKWEIPVGLEITKCAVVCDDNGWDNIENVVANVSYPNGTSYEEDEILTRVTEQKQHVCIDSLHEHYKTLKDWDIRCAVFNGTLQMKNPAMDPEGDYGVNITAIDEDGLISDGINNTFHYEGSLGIDIDVESILFSTLNPGQSFEVLGDSNFTDLTNATVKNTGTSTDPIDIDATATNLTSNGDSIAKSNLEIGIGDDALAVYYPMDHSGYDVNLAQGLTKWLNAKLYVPYGTSAGEYTGTLTLTAIAG